MAEFKLAQISTVLLGVKSTAESLKFYSDKLGIGVSMQFEGFAFLQTSGVMLVLSEDLARALGAGAGATEVVFTVEGVREAYDALRERGIEFANQPRQISGPQWGANFRDPDGHMLSILGPEKRPMTAAQK